MIDLSHIIRHLHPDAVPLRDYTVSLARGGATITHWNESILGPLITAEQIEVARLELEPIVAARSALWQARLAMAAAWASLPADMRADHAHDYACIEAALIRGDVEAARLRIERVELLPEREQYRAQFLAMFPPQPE